MSPESDDESESPSGQLFGDQPQKPARDLYDEAVEVWKAEVCEPLGRPKVQPCGRGTSAGKSLLARLTQPIDGLPSGIEAWTLICRWYATSQHKRAQWLRDGGYRAKTLVVPDNWVEYLAFAVEEEQQAPARASPAESRRRRTNDAMRRLAERFDT